MKLKVIKEIIDAIDITTDHVLEIKKEVADIKNNTVTKKDISVISGPKGDPGAPGESVVGPRGATGKQGPIGPAGPKGKDGEDGKDGSPDTPEIIRGKLESLAGEDRLDKSAIRGLDYLPTKKDFDKLLKQKTKGGLSVASFAGSGSGGGGTWGTITGTLSNQTDLQNALNAKEDVANKSTDTALGTSDTLYPTQNAVKTYVDSIAPPIFSPTLGNNRALVVDDFVHVTGSGGTFNTAFMAFSGGNVVSVNNTISTLGNEQGVVVCNHNGSGDNLWSMNRTVALGQGALKLACYFRRPSDSGAANQSNVRIGLRLSTGDGTDGVFFKLNEATNSDLWQCITRASSTSTTTNTSVSTTKGNWVKLYIVINAAGNEVLFYINGTLVATHTTNIPASGTALSGIINVERTVVSSTLAYAIDYFMVDQTFTTAR